MPLTATAPRMDIRSACIDCIGKLEQITFVERGDSVTFERAFNRDTGLWESSIDAINLWDCGDDDAGNSPTPPLTFGRAVWSAPFDAASGDLPDYAIFLRH
jgi:hypothetical protein